MKTVCYIICPGHSGSTLLGNVLGSHSRCFHIGELIAPISKGKPVRCRYCADACPVWGSLIKPHEVKAMYEAFVEWNRTRSATLRQKVLGDHNRIYRRVFNACRDVSVLVDSSKNVNWARYNASRKYRFFYIFLRRDLRAFFNSMNRSYGNLRDGALIDDLDRTVKGLSSLYSSLPKDRKMVIDYEAFVRDPERILSAAAQALHIEYEPAMLEFYRFPQHLIGGNPSLVAQADGVAEADRLASISADAVSQESLERLKGYTGLKGFRLDESWRNELSESDQQYVTASLTQRGLVDENSDGAYLYYRLG